MVLHWFSPTQNLLLPGVRERIVHELFTPAVRRLRSKSARRRAVCVLCQRSELSRPQIIATIRQLATGEFANGIRFHPAALVE
jgi:hypothetical protein